MNPLPNSFGQPRSSNGYISSDNCLPQLRQQASWDITMSYPRTEPMKDWGFSGDLNPFILYPAIFTEHAQLIHFASASHWLSCWQHLKNLLSPKNWLIEIILSIRMSENILSPKNWLIEIILSVRMSENFLSVRKSENILSVWIEVYIINFFN